jgi:FG-GAP-like repeat
MPNVMGFFYSAISRQFPHYLGPFFLCSSIHYMQHLSIPTTFLLQYARRGALLLALGAAAPAAWGQSFGPLVAYSTGRPDDVVHLALGDVNGDGRLDAVTTNYAGNTVLLLLGQPGGGLLGSARFPLPTRSIPAKVVLGDVNGDGRLDVLTASSGSSNVDVLLGQAGGGFAPSSTYPTDTNPQGLALGDVNGDGRPDVVTANQDSHTVGVLLGLPAGGFGPVSTYPTGAYSGPRAVAVRDLNADGRPDLITANFGSNTVGVLLALAGGGFGAVSLYPAGPLGGPLALAIGDVNADGQPDVVTANFSGSTAGVLLGQAGGGLAPVE